MSAPAVNQVSKRQGMMVVAVLGGMFLAMLDQNIVATALPHMVHDLGGAQFYTWVVSAYLLASTVTLPVYGRLADVYGNRRFLLIGLAVFFVGSALCAIAGNMAQLVAFRAVQGLGAGALMPISLSLIAGLFRIGNAGRLSALIGVAMAVAYAAGPSLGGVFADVATWRLVFVLNLPLAALVIAMVLLALPADTVATDRPRPDYLGIVVFTLALLGILVGLTEKGLDGSAGTTNPWSSPFVLWPVVVGVVLLVWFVVIETRHPNSIIPLGFFRSGLYTAVNLVSFFTAFGLYTSVIFLPRYFQAVRGLSATESGLLIYPVLLGLVASNFVAGSIIGKTRRYKTMLLGSLVALCAGCGLVALLGPHTSPLPLTLWMLLIGIGLGPTLAGLIVVIQDVVPPEYTSTASAALTFFRQIGGVVGLTVAGTIYLQRVRQVPSGAGSSAAITSGISLVIPLLGGIGALICVVAFAWQPEWPLWTNHGKISPWTWARRDTQITEGTA